MTDCNQQFSKFLPQVDPFFTRNFLEGTLLRLPELTNS